MLNQSRHSEIGKYITFILLCVGLWAEYNAISSILSEEKLVKPGIITLIVNSVIIAMLFHHFFIIKNFHDFDHMNEREVVRTGFGNWILHSFGEHCIRFILFLLFAVLTGEIIYLKIIMQKNEDLLNHCYFHKYPVTHEVIPKMYDITWTTKWYLISALILSILMIFWDGLGWLYDSKWKPLLPQQRAFRNQKKINASYRIFKISNPYFTFILCDSFAFCLWLLLNGTYFNWFSDASILMLLFTTPYIFFVAARVITVLTSIPRYLRANRFLWKRKSKKEHLITFLKHI